MIEPSKASHLCHGLTGRGAGQALTDRGAGLSGKLEQVTASVK
jgi:hypothetical protein